MVRTLEGALKQQIKLYLKQLGAYYFQPVQMGMGMQTLDFLVCVPQWHNGGRIGRFVAIETKAPGKKPTPRQMACGKDIIEAGGIAFYCDSFESFKLTMVAHGLVPPAKK